MFDFDTQCATTTNAQFTAAESDWHGVVFYVNHRDGAVSVDVFARDEDGEYHHEYMNWYNRAS